MSENFTTHRSGESTRSEAAGKGPVALPENREWETLRCDSSATGWSMCHREWRATEPSPLSADHCQRAGNPRPLYQASGTGSRRTRTRWFRENTECPRARSLDDHVPFPPGVGRIYAPVATGAFWSVPYLLATDHDDCDAA